MLRSLDVKAAGEEFPISTANERAVRRDRQTREMESHQHDLRTSIATSKRLVDEADAMIRRHRDECDEAEAKG